MARKKRLHELARELDVTTDRLMEIAMRHGMRFTSNFNAVEPEQEEKLRIAVKGPIRVMKAPIVKIVRTAKQKAAEAAARAAEEAGEEIREVEAADTEAPAVAEPSKPKPEVAEEPVAAEAEKSPEAPPEKAPAEEVEIGQEEAVAEIEEKAEEEREQVEPVIVEDEERPRIKIERKKPAEEREAVRAEAVGDVDKAAKPKPPIVKEKIKIPRPMPPPKRAGKAAEVPTEAPPRRKRRRKRRKERVAAAQEDLQVVKKKRAKMPTQPKVDHVMLAEGMTLKELSEKLGIKAKDIIQKLLLEKGTLASINQVLDLDLAKWIASRYGVSSEEVSYEEEVALEDELKVEGEAVERAPVVTLMGHVDHGKTTLLDVIRESNVVAGEFGGITQHIGAYKIEHNKKPIVFLDTPGHEAFTRLRARGAQVTDIVLLVVAADDGVMPQTVEAIQHAKAAKVPILVVIAKTDLQSADIEKVKKGLADHEVLVESWGGDIVSVEVSGKKKKGIDDLLEMILLLAEMQNLKAYPDIKGMGTVLEARLDRAKGPVATVLAQNGTVKVGDYFIAGTTMGRIKAMIDDRGNRLVSAGPATPIEILGFSTVPEAGDQFQVVDDETKARQMVAYRQEKSRASQMAGTSKLSLDDLFSRIEEGVVKELPLIVKGDVRGSVEALSDALEKVSTDKVHVDIKLAQPGAITESDILLASTSNAIIIGFNVRAQRGVAQLAEKHGVEIRIYNVIYEVVKEVKVTLLY